MATLHHRFHQQATELLQKYSMSMKISKLESQIKITKQIAKEKGWTKEQLETELNYLGNQLNELRLEQL